MLLFFSELIGNASISVKNGKFIVHSIYNVSSHLITTVAEGKKWYVFNEELKDIVYVLPEDSYLKITASISHDNAKCKIEILSLDLKMKGLSSEPHSRELVKNYFTHFDESKFIEEAINLVNKELENIQKNTKINC